MSTSQSRLASFFSLLVVAIATSSLLLGQTSTPTPPVDNDGDGVPNHQDGWPDHKLLISPPVPDSQYVVIKLGSGRGYGINNLGHVVGSSNDNENGDLEAIVWRVGLPPTFLGFLTNDPNALRESVATAINDAGIITGFATYAWEPNVTGTYPNPPIYPQLLNYREDYAGYHSNYWDTHAFRWQSGVMSDLNDLSFGRAAAPDQPNGANKGSSSGLAINNAGEMVGESDSSLVVSNVHWNWQITSQVKHPVSFSIGALPQDLNLASTSADFVMSDATAINDRRAIIGRGARNGYSAFFTGVEGVCIPITPSVKQGATSITTTIEMQRWTGPFGNWINRPNPMPIMDTVALVMRPQLGSIGIPDMVPRG